jgi:hypothetical protein
MWRIRLVILEEKSTIASCWATSTHVCIARYKDNGNFALETYLCIQETLTLDHGYGNSSRYNFALGIACQQQTQSYSRSTSTK